MLALDRGLILCRLKDMASMIYIKNLKIVKEKQFSLCLSPSLMSVFLAFVLLWGFFFVVLEFLGWGAINILLKMSLLFKIMLLPANSKWVIHFQTKKPRKSPKLFTSFIDMLSLFYFQCKWGFYCFPNHYIITLCFSTHFSPCPICLKKNLYFKAIC